MTTKLESNNNWKLLPLSTPQTLLSLRTIHVDGKGGREVYVCAFVYQMQVREQEDGKEKKKVSEVRIPPQQCVSGEAWWVFHDKAVYFHRLSVPDLPLVPQSHGLDLGKQCVCVYVCVSAFIRSHHFWVDGTESQLVCSATISCPSTLL